MNKPHYLCQSFPSANRKKTRHIAGPAMPDFLIFQNNRRHIHSFSRGKDPANQSAAGLHPVISPGTSEEK